MSNYEYFSGANVTIKLNDKDLVECAGISYSISNSKQPVYSYESVQFDAVLTGREIVEGRFVINYKSPNYLYDLIQDNSRSISPTNYNSFNIEIVYPDNNENIIIRNCFQLGVHKLLK